MRPFHGMVLALAALAVGCGDDGGNGPANTPPTANFEPPTCNLLSCTFTDASSDADGSIASRSWTFENGTPAQSTEANPTVSFAAAGTYTVTLSVTDNEGATDDFSREVTVSTTPGNQPPVAGFTPSCNSLDCTFTNTSADVDGTFTSSWNFGDPASGTNNTSSETDGSHTYAVTAVTDFTVTLTVTDDDGATATATQSIRVSPPAGLVCDGVDCTLDLTERSTVTITVTEAHCQFTGNAFTILAPITETVFSDGCSLTVPAVFQINGGAAFDAGTQLQAQFTQGSEDPTDPPKGPPATQVDGSFPDWTIKFDDGGLPSAPRDFNDIVLAVHATVVP
jgi:PKD repeat protein